MCPPPDRSLQPLAGDVELSPDPPPGYAGSPPNAHFRSLGGETAHSVRWGEKQPTPFAGGRNARSVSPPRSEATLGVMVLYTVMLMVGSSV